MTGTEQGNGEHSQPVAPQPLDAARVYQWADDLADLVEQVARTHEHNEANWIEWKSEYDLELRESQQQIARQVLGFSNRTVPRARPFCQGHAYLIVGADPARGVCGISTLDPAKLRAGVESWTGTAVRWHVNYVRVQGKDVLVVAVEPPRDGDPIFPLRKDMVDKDGKTRPKGRIFVRRAGGTHEADDTEIDALAARAAAGGTSTRVQLSPLGAVEAYPSMKPAKEVAQAERAATLERLVIGAVPGERPPHLTYAPIVSDLLGPSIPGHREVSPERRSWAEYEAEVDEYARKCGQALQARRCYLLGHHEALQLRLSIANETDTTLERLVVCLRVNGSIRRLPASWDTLLESGEEPELPERPEQWGTAHVTYPANRYAETLLPRPQWLLPAIRSTAFGAFEDTPSFEITDRDGAVEIQFSPIDLRANQQGVALPPVPLRVDEPEGAVLTCDWTATAHNARGEDGGRFSLKTTPSSFVDPADELGR